MTIKNLNPYLNFDGTATQAIALYERVFGVAAQEVSRFADIPGNTPAPENADRIIHARIPLGTNLLMISDTQPGLPFTTEGNVHVAIEFDDAKDLAARFEALAQGGTVTMPVADTFWGASFGMLTDAYGVRWMFNGPKAGV